MTGVALCALAALPASAFAADSFVDKQTGSGTACTQVTPCDNVVAGVTAAGTNDTVHVDDSATAYLEQVALGNGKSLIADNFVGGAEGLTIIDGGAGTAVSVLATAAGTVQGFNLRGDGSGLETVENVTVTGNTFDDPFESGADIQISAVGPGTVISGNTLNGAPAGMLDNGIAMSAGADPTIVNNSLSGYDFAISPGNDGTDPLIQDNTISGGESDHSLAAGIFVNDDAEPTLIHNTVQLPAGGTRGIYILENTVSGTNTGATLRRNRVLGIARGIVVEDTTGVVTLDSDLIANSSISGLRLHDDPVNGGLGADQGDASATNVTLASNSTDITVLDADLTLDSSIVEDAVADSGTATCAITFSRGPLMAPGAPGCDNFQTIAAPGFVGGANFHLAPGSAMIDLGNPAAPPLGAIDFDGDLRAIDADGACPVDRIRDIGADEFLATEPVCNPPVTTPTSPSTPPTGKKKKKCKKAKKGVVAAKKKCKRKK